jgi:hypothetical protein
LRLDQLVRAYVFRLDRNSLRRRHSLCSSRF